MVKSDHSIKKNTHNRGVNTALDAYPGTEDDASSEFPSLHNVRSQLQNVIDVIGTSTPHLVFTSSGSGDADNEDSVISSTSIFSSVLQVKHVNNTDQLSPPTMSTYNSPRDISEISQTTETYEMVNEMPHERFTRTPSIPAVLCVNPSCMCTHSLGYMQGLPVAENPSVITCGMQRGSTEKKHKLAYLIEKFTKSNRDKVAKQTELYKMNITQTSNDTFPPQRFVFDLVDELPKPETNNVGTNTKNQNHITSTSRNICINERVKTVTHKKATHEGINTRNSKSAQVMYKSANPEENQNLQNATYYKNLEENNKLPYRIGQGTSRIDIYYFDHGNAAYYRTTDSPPLIHTEIIAEKTERHATKFWAEVFGTIYIGFAFFTSFILQFFRFILYSLVRPLTIGILQILSDYFFKPFLATLFNAVIQPPLIFVYNIATSLRDLCDPLAEGIGYFCREIAGICKSIRFFEIKKEQRIVNSETRKRQPEECNMTNC